MEEVSKFHVHLIIVMKAHFVEGKLEINWASRWDAQVDDVTDVWVTCWDISNYWIIIIRTIKMSKSICQFCLIMKKETNFSLNIQLKSLSINEISICFTEIRTRP